MDIISCILELALGVMFCVTTAVGGSWLFVPIGICFLLRGVLALCQHRKEKK